MSNKQHLYSIYQRIKNNCCEQWKDSKNFYLWYEKQDKEQLGLCHYCHLPGNTETYYGKTFREGRRGLSLEVDRKDSGQKYSPNNCVLACYPCNNAKSDVFFYKEFLKIGELVGEVKKMRMDKHTS